MVGSTDVLVKLREGQTLHHSRGGSTDEGWSSESNIFSFDGRTVTNEWCTDGCDCDGRLSRGGVSFCTVRELRAGYSENGVAFPKWQNVGDYQRDFSAEAMGY
jgi:hypothetical protein